MGVSREGAYACVFDLMEGEGRGGWGDIRHVLQSARRDECRQVLLRKPARVMAQGVHGLAVGHGRTDSRVGVARPTCPQSYRRVPEM
jgi:hypothetical protein